MSLYLMTGDAVSSATSHKLSTEDARRFMFGGTAVFTMDARRQEMGTETFKVVTKFHQTANGDDILNRPRVAFVRDSDNDHLGTIFFDNNKPVFRPKGAGQMSKAEREQRKRRMAWMIRLVHIMAGDVEVELLDESNADFVHSGRCSICGRTLTNAESIERGIGPVCLGKM